MRREESSHPRLGAAHALVLAHLGRTARGQRLTPREVGQLLGRNTRDTLIVLGALVQEGLLTSKANRYTLTATGQALVDDNAPEAPAEPTLRVELCHAGDWFEYGRPETLTLDNHLDDPRGPRLLNELGDEIAQPWRVYQGDDLIASSGIRDLHATIVPA